MCLPGHEKFSFSKTWGDGLDSLQNLALFGETARPGLFFREALFGETARPGLFLRDPLLDFGLFGTLACTDVACTGIPSMRLANDRLPVKPLPADCTSMGAALLGFIVRWWVHNSASSSAFFTVMALKLSMVSAIASINACCISVWSTDFCAAINSDTESAASRSCKSSTCNTPSRISRA